MIVSSGFRQVILLMTLGSVHVVSSTLNSPSSSKQIANFHMTVCPTHHFVVGHDQGVKLNALGVEECSKGRGLSAACLFSAACSQEDVPWWHLSNLGFVAWSFLRQTNLQHPNPNLLVLQPTRRDWAAYRHKKCNRVVIHSPALMPRGQWCSHCEGAPGLRCSYLSRDGEEQEKP